MAETEEQVKERLVREHLARQRVAFGNSSEEDMVFDPRTEPARIAFAESQKMVVPPNRMWVVPDQMPKLHPGEPYFVLRAQDILSTMALLHYGKLLEDYVPLTEKSEGLVDRLNEFRAWQQANPDKVKLPD